MNRSFVAMIALLALAGPSSAAGITAQAELALPTGGSHTLEIYVADDGGYYVLLDGQPVDPSTIGAPGLPAGPSVPPMPSPTAPSAPGLPSLPGVPGIPAFPTLP